MKLFLLTFLAFSFGVACAQQEWEDIKGHQGSGENSNRANANPAFLNGRFRNTKLRNIEKNEVTGVGRDVDAKTKRRIVAGMNQERAHATDSLNRILAGTQDLKIVDCSSCGGLGIETCAGCGGDGGQECSVCHGTPQLNCRACDGQGLVSDLPCVSCNGSGKKECQFCNGISRNCSTCAGMGYGNCHHCHGIGRQLALRQPGDSVRVSNQRLPETFFASPANTPIPSKKKRR